MIILAKQQRVTFGKEKQVLTLLLEKLKIETFNMGKGTVSAKASFDFFGGNFSSDMSFRRAFFCFFVIRVIAALTSHIRDCDETFNYWEPTHYLMYGYGLQTWEYSPVYALRSYAYVLLHIILGQTVRLFVEVEDKIIVFYGMRLCLGTVCALCEAFFYVGVSHRFGNRVGRYTFIFSILSTGMYFSSVAYLPSSFAMYAVMASFGAWFQGMQGYSIFYAAAGIIISCWPFVGVVFLPLSFDALYIRGFFKVLVWGIKLILFMLMPVILIDSFFYGSWGVFTLFNLINYNVFRANAVLYGVEPWTYYFINAFLNFSFAWPLALLAIVLPVVAKVSGAGGVVRPFLPALTPARVALYLSPLFIWLLVMQSRPHKEERFLYVIYPLVALSAGMSFDVLSRFAATKISAPVTKAGTYLFFAAFAGLSLSRTASELISFRAPLQLYRHLYHDELREHISRRGVAHDEDRTVQVCVGKEWYRFPASFFLSSNSRLAFIDSGFNGQLPQPYFELEGGTRLIPNDMNDMNEEENSRYIPHEECHYLVDLDIGPEDGNRVYNNSAIEGSDRWEQIYQVPFLDGSNSPRFSRVFYVPFYSQRKNSYYNYVLLRNNRVEIPTHKHIHTPKQVYTHAHRPKTPPPSIKKRKGLTKELLVHMLPDIIETAPLIHKTTNVVYTKPGSEGYWNRQITESHPRLLFVYGENHRDFLKMRAWFDKEHGELRPQWHYTDQKTTQGNIRGEPNAFPIRTMWYHTIPGSDQYQNWFADRELKINSNVITEDINRIIEAWEHGTYDFVVLGSKMVGTGVANLQERAPITYDFLKRELKRLQEIIDEEGSRVIRLQEHQGSEKEVASSENVETSNHDDL